MIEAHLNFINANLFPLFLTSPLQYFVQTHEKEFLLSYLGDQGHQFARVPVAAIFNLLQYLKHNIYCNLLLTSCNKYYVLNIVIN